MIVLIASEKGGTGKTTIATNLAALRSKNHEVLLIDTDPQGSASNWVSLRDSDKNLSQIFSAQKFGIIDKEILKLSKKFEDIIIDAGGRDSKELRSGMLVCDTMYIPMQASQFDMWSLSKMSEIVNQGSTFNSSLMTKIVINRASSNPMVKEVKEAKELILEIENIQLSEIIIHERIAFRKAAREGKSVQDLNNDIKAVYEISSLYKDIFHGK